MIENKNKIYDFLMLLIILIINVFLFYLAFYLEHLMDVNKWHYIPNLFLIVSIVVIFTFFNIANIGYFLDKN